MVRRLLPRQARAPGSRGRSQSFSISVGDEGLGCFVKAESIGKIFRHVSPRLSAIPSNLAFLSRPRNLRLRKYLKFHKTKTAGRCAVIIRQPRHLISQFYEAPRW